MKERLAAEKGEEKNLLENDKNNPNYQGNNQGNVNVGSNINQDKC